MFVFNLSYACYFVVLILCNFCFDLIFAVFLFSTDVCERPFCVSLVLSLVEFRTCH